MVLLSPPPVVVPSITMPVPVMLVVPLTKFWMRNPVMVLLLACNTKPAGFCPLPLFHRELIIGRPQLHNRICVVASMVTVSVIVGRAVVSGWCARRRRRC